MEMSIEELEEYRVKLKIILEELQQEYRIKLIIRLEELDESYKNHRMINKI